MAIWNYDLWKAMKLSPLQKWRLSSEALHTCGKKRILHFCEIAPVEKEEETEDQLFLRERKQAPNQAHLALADWLFRREFSAIKPEQKWSAVMTHCQPFLSWIYTDQEKCMFFIGFCFSHPALLLSTDCSRAKQRSEGGSQFHLLSSGSVDARCCLGSIACKSGVLWDSEKRLGECFEILEWA